MSDPNADVCQRFASLAWMSRPKVGAQRFMSEPKQAIEMICLELKGAV